MNNVNRFILCVFIIICSSQVAYAQLKNSCLYRNPLCFYNTDILTYLQVLHKNQQYDKMIPFFYGEYLKTKGQKGLKTDLENGEFGYAMKRAGIRETGKNKWSITYQRTILGTNETFKIDCSLINDTCRIYLDQKTFKTIFRL
ncbi:MAG: hypothetical protein ACO23V_00560 [Chitinophagaceae bacterium]|jgi:hypothetical protein